LKFAQVVIFLLGLWLFFGGCASSSSSGLKAVHAEDTEDEYLAPLFRPPDVPCDWVVCEDLREVYPELPPKQREGFADCLERCGIVPKGQNE
jgi:hypothetical protein